MLSEAEIRVLSVILYSDRKTANEIAEFIGVDLDSITECLISIKEKTSWDDSDFINTLLDGDKVELTLWKIFEEIHAEHHFKRLSKTFLKDTDIKSINLYISGKIFEDQKVSIIAETLDDLGISFILSKDLKIVGKAVNHNMNMVFVLDSISEFLRLRELSTRFASSSFLIISELQNHTSLLAADNVSFIDKWSKKDLYIFVVNYLLHHHSDKINTDSLQDYLLTIAITASSNEPAASKGKSRVSRVVNSIITQVKKKTTIMAIISGFLLLSSIIIYLETYSGINIKDRFINLKTVILQSDQSGNIYDFHLPRQIDNFIARPEASHAIWQAIKRDGDNFVIINGPAGIGKTTIAVDAVLHPLKKYEMRGWFNAKNEHILKTEILMLGELNHLFNKDNTPSEKISIVLEWLGSMHTFLVFDNAQDLELAKKYTPKQSDILVTTSLESNMAITVNPMTEVEGVNLSNIIIADAASNNLSYLANVHKLIASLNHSPLAIMQAGKYIAKQKISVNAYLEKYLKNMQATTNSSLLEPMSPADLSAWHTWRINYEAVQDNPVIKKTLEFLAYCDANAVPKSLLQQYLFHNVKQTSARKLDFILDELQSYGLIHQKGSIISLHNLNHTWLKNIMDPCGKPILLRQIVKTVKKVYPFVNNSNTALTTIKLLIPQIETVLAQAHTALDVKEYIEVISILADAYKRVGHYSRAEEILLNATALTKQEYGTSNIRLAHIHHTLGEIYYRQGRYGLSIEQLNIALDVKQQRYGAEHIRIVPTLHWLGKAKHKVGLTVTAQKHLQHALAITKNYFTKYNQQAMELVYDLAKINYALGQDHVAKKLLEQSLMLAEKINGKDHIANARIKHYLGLVHHNMGLTRDAKKFLEEAFLAKIKHFGANHLKTARTMHALGRVYTDLHQPYFAIELMEHALKIHEKYYGLDHLDNANILYSLSAPYYQLSNRLKAHQLLELALLIKQRYYNERTIDQYQNGDLGRLSMLNKHHSSAKLEQKIVNLRATYSRDSFTIEEFLLQGIISIDDLLHGSVVKGRVLLDLNLDLANRYYGFNSELNSFMLGSLAMSYLLEHEHKKSAHALAHALAVLPNNSMLHFLTLHSRLNRDDAASILVNNLYCKKMFALALDSINIEPYKQVFLARMFAKIGMLYGGLQHHKRQSYFNSLVASLRNSFTTTNNNSTDALLARMNLYIR